MRKLLVVALVLAVVVAAGSLGDVLIRHAVEGAIADHVEAQLPGAHADVHISSFPFVGRLAVSGKVPTVTAEVSGVAAGPLTFDRVDVHIADVRVQRSRILHGQVQLRSIRQATVVARVSQASIDSEVGLPVTLGTGTVGVGGLQVPAQVSVNGERVEVAVPPLPAVSITIPVTRLLPCLGAASIEPGELVVSCTTDQLPPVLNNVAASMF